MVVADESAPLFSERLTPSLTTWLLAPSVGAIFFIMFLPANVTVAIAAGVVSAALAALWLWSLAAIVELTTTHLRVGRAEIEIEALGEATRSEEHTSELQSRGHLVCRLLLEKKNNTYKDKSKK